MSTDNTDLINIADDTKTIPTLGSGTFTDATFTADRWGYKKNRLADDYSAFPASSTLLQSSTRVNADTANMRFATKVDYLQASGTYKTTINFQLVDNPPIEMQNLDSSLCTTTQTRVLDNRDGQYYGIRRLADGNCWMVQNLNFKGSSTDATGTMTLNTETSNVQRDTILTYTDLTDGDSYDIARIHASGSDVKGVWYNYAAASAGTITGSSNTIDASSDVCPRGWRMPTQIEQNALVTAISSDTSMFSPITGGFYSGGNLNSNINRGLFWASTAGGDADRPALRYDGDDGFKTGFSYNRYIGFYLRCILDTRTLSDITYMQEMTPTIVTNTTNGTSKTLTDTRDSKTYSVRKIGDDIWMTRNLDIGCSGTGSTYGTSISQKTIDSLTSNTNSSYSTPTALLTNASSSTETADLSNGRMQCDATYGGYYNYAAASAGTIVGASPTGDATADICPRGWQLPTYARINSIINTIGSSPSSFSPVIGSRYRYGSKSDYEGISGLWWGSTYRNGGYNYMLYKNSVLSNSITTGRALGLNIRCVAKK
ncbi:hypothetical protein IJI18_02445 [Candidatus Saccharibacteria bacterium]|nr:hypothetical protein [Candidatus Saccharibacteria bacterium]